MQRKESNMLKLTLLNGTEIELSEAGYPQHYVVNNITISEFVQVLAQMVVPENLSEIILNEDGFERIIVGSQLVGTQTMSEGNDKVTGHFYLEGGETEIAATNDRNYESLSTEELEMVAIILAGQIMNGTKTIEDIKNPIVRKKVAQILKDSGFEELAGEE